ncbi:hypothetical protein NTH_02196 [Nitratireductor thuwali]|uniref:Uncharacterized protein n=1 Tax=Nitratireductor thuwali TaxID=2267699 RepID=A0ABY5MIA4_9HYPH|nr:hypothetical protein NTH_02196 [Nitratireductor thuwali]
MARRRILALGNLVGGTVERFRPSGGTAAWRAGGQRVGGIQTQPPHIGHMERTGSQTFPVAGSRGAGLHDMAVRVRPLIAEAGGVRSVADAEGIEDEQECAGHAWCSVGGASEIVRGRNIGNAAATAMLTDGSQAEWRSSGISNRCRGS